MFSSSETIQGTFVYSCLLRFSRRTKLQAATSSVSVNVKTIQLQTWTGP